MPLDDLLNRVATFFASASLSGAFSGLLAAAIDNLNGKGGKPGWAWIFILVGSRTRSWDFTYSHYRKEYSPFALELSPFSCSLARLSVRVSSQQLRRHMSCPYLDRMAPCHRKTRTTDSAGGKSLNRSNHRMFGCLLLSCFSMVCANPFD